MEGPGTTLAEVSYPLGADDARVWAAIREMELRRPRYALAKLGVVGVVATRMIPALRSMTEALAGLDGLDPPGEDPAPIYVGNVDDLGFNGISERLSWSEISLDVDPPCCR